MPAVPLIVSWPGVTTGNVAGTAVDEQVYQFDLVPTLCDLVGINVPEGWSGRSFAPALAGDAFEGRDYLVCGHGIYTYGRSVYSGDWVYSRLIHPGVYSLPRTYNDPDLPNWGTRTTSRPE